MSKGNLKGLFKTSNFDWLYSGMTDEHFMHLKKHFAKSIKAWMKWERAQCAKKNLTPLFNNEKANKVSSILDQCKDYYELESLRKAVFDLNYVPESYDQVKQGAAVLREK